VVLGVLENGAKLVLGVRQGATENATVCTALLEELCARGLDASQPTLLVLDGSKALHAAVKRVWGRNALIQRCQAHKKRNVREHLPQKHWPELSRQLRGYLETWVIVRRFVKPQCDSGTRAGYGRSTFGASSGRC
jgi:transposase-like protein